jgi:hypothetical protein
MRVDAMKEKETEVIINNQMVKVKVDNEQNGNSELSAKVAVNSNLRQEIAQNSYHKNQSKKMQSKGQYGIVRPTQKPAMSIDKASKTTRKRIN